MKITNFKHFSSVGLFFERYIGETNGTPFSVTVNWGTRAVVVHQRGKRPRYLTLDAYTAAEGQNFKQWLETQLDKA